MQHTERSHRVKFSERHFTMNGVDLNVAASDAPGPPLLLLHGVTRCWRDYLDVIPGLAGFGQVIALDHRGHGGSPGGHDHYRVRDCVEDAVAFLRAEISEPAVLIGHSLGAMTAATIAARVPQRVRGLVLEDPPGSLLASGIQESRYWLQFTGLRILLFSQAWEAWELAEALAKLPVQHPLDGRTVLWSELRDPAALRFAAECLARMDPRVLDDLVEGRWLEDLDWFAELSNIRCPTLLLHADSLCGGMLAESEALRVESGIRQCKRVDFPQLGHNLHGTAPARYLDEVTRFLQDIS